MTTAASKNREDEAAKARARNVKRFGWLCVLWPRIQVVSSVASFSESEGRVAFGKNVSGYDSSRPDYLDWVFDKLVEQGSLAQDAATLEIGSGNGLATTKLVQSGVSPLTLIEPDERFASLLTPLMGDKDTLLTETFEDATLAFASFDLVFIATAYHWLDPATRISKLAQVTKCDGFVALLWNVFQNLSLEDPFHEATKGLLSNLSHSPSGKPDTMPFALDREAREREFSESELFRVFSYHESHWSLSLKPKEVRSLFEGFSQIARLPSVKREGLLDEFEAIATQQFSGLVERNMTTVLYVFQRI